MKIAGCLRSSQVYGGLRTYGMNYHELIRCAAGDVDKILKIAKPADLPV